MNLLPLVAAAVAALVATAIVTPLTAKLAIFLGVIDRPSERKVSDRKGIPLLGGLAVVLGCLSGFFAFGLIAESPDFALVQGQLATFMAGGMLLVLVGAWDDRFELGAWQKLPFQLLASLIAINGGFVIDYFTNPITLTTSPLPVWLSWMITLGWIVVVTNAMNLIDGLDGLTAGTGAIIAGTLGVICYQAGQVGGLLIAAVTMGALLGFLPFNFPPARIFLGDAGALFIGFALAIVAVEGYRKAALLTFVVPLLALAVPLLDTGLSIIRRLRAGKGIFSADKMHIHHLLLAREGSHRRAVLWLYFQTLCFSIIALSFSDLRGYSAYIFLGAVILLTLRMVRNLGVLQVEEYDSDSDGSHKPSRVPPEELPK